VHHRIGRLVRSSDAIVLAVAALPRLFIAYTDHGMIWGDEIYQSLEPAHRLAFGYGITVWEFKDGARSWLFPGVLALVMKVGALFGAHTGLAVVGLVKTFMVAMGLVGIFAGMRLASLLGGQTAALLAGVLGATFPPSLVFGSRAMSETASGMLIVVASWFALRSERRFAWLAGAIAATAIYLRYQNGLVALALLVVLVARRRFGQASRYAAAAAIVGLLGGALDYLTWGRFFQSFLVYWKFNFVEGGAARWGTAPWSFYFEVARTASGPLLWILALGIVLALRRAPGLVFVAAVFVLAHCQVAHKEFRFLMPIVPLALTLAGTGLGAALDLVDRRRVVGPWLALSLAAAFGARTRAMTLAEMGQFADVPEWGAAAPWNFFGGINRAMAEAGTRDDLCGLTIVGIQPWWMGGFSYLHRDVPLFVGQSPVALAASNYLIAQRAMSTPESYVSVASFEDDVLLRRGGPCAPRPREYRHPLE
jgi:hypothetical protein